MPDEKPPNGKPPIAKVVPHPRWTELQESMVADALESLCEMVEEDYAGRKMPARARTNTRGIYCGGDDRWDPRPIKM